MRQLIYLTVCVLGAQTAQIAAAKAAAKVQEGAAQAYDVSKQKASEAYTSTAEYLKEKVGPCAAPQTLQICRPAPAAPAGMPCRQLVGMPANRHIEARPIPVWQCVPCYAGTCQSANCSDRHASKLCHGKVMLCACRANSNSHFALVTCWHASKWCGACHARLKGHMSAYLVCCFACWPSVRSPAGT